MQPESRVFLPIVIDALDRIIDPNTDVANKKRYAYVARRALVQMRVREERLPALLIRWGPEIEELTEQAEKWLGLTPRPLPKLPGDREAHWHLLTGRLEYLLAQVSKQIARKGTIGIPDFMAQAARCQRDLRRAVSEAEGELEREPLAGAEKQTIAIGSLESLLRAKWNGAERLHATSATPVGGTHSKEIYIVDVADAPHGDRRVVVRRDREVSIAGTSVSHEFALLKGLFELGAPVPEPILGTEDGGPLGRAAVVTRFSQGTEYYRVADVPEPKALVRQCAKFLAQLHTAPPPLLGFGEQIDGRGAEERIVQFIRRHYLWWKNITYEGSSEIECAYAWLMQHTRMVADSSCVLHGDFDIRNFLIVDGRLNAVLDWELAHLGHPAEDLGYIRNTVEAILPWKEFLATYRGYGGVEVSEESLRYCQVMGDFRNSVFATSAFHVYRTGQLPDPFLAAAGITTMPLDLLILGNSLENALREYP
jgi:aminoglycoside phosphotransferase (APT) family kinase protein